MHAGCVRRAAGAVFFAALLVSMSGCSGKYSVTFHCEDRINAQGLRDDQPGRGLRVVLVSLDERAFEELGNEVDGINVEGGKTWQAIQATSWFQRGMDKKVAAIVSDPLAIKEERLVGGESKTVNIKHPAAGKKNSGILVLASFYGDTEGAANDAFISRVWLPVEGWFFPKREFKIDVGPTYIRRAD